LSKDFEAHPKRKNVFVPVKKKALAGWDFSVDRQVRFFVDLKPRTAPEPKVRRGRGAALTRFLWRSSTHWVGQTNFPLHIFFLFFF